MNYCDIDDSSNVKGFAYYVRSCLPEKERETSWAITCAILTFGHIEYPMDRMHVRLERLDASLLSILGHDRYVEALERFRKIPKREPIKKKEKPRKIQTRSVTREAKKQKTSE